MKLNEADSGVSTMVLETLSIMVDISLMCSFSLWDAVLTPHTKWWACSATTIRLFESARLGIVLSMRSKLVRCAENTNGSCWQKL
jgi:hypothetical protein